MSEQENSGCGKWGCFFALVIAFGVTGNLVWRVSDPEGYDEHQRELETEREQAAVEREQEEAQEAVEREAREERRRSANLEREQRRIRRQQEIDDAQSAEITRDEFLRIQPRMSYSEIVSIVGSEGELVRDLIMGLIYLCDPLTRVR